MDDAIYSKLEEVGFSISDREFSLSEIIGTPSHIEISYEMELGQHSFPVSDHSFLGMEKTL